MKALFEDNPILVKHIRARLRPQQLIAWVVIVVIVCALIMYSKQTSYEPKASLYMMIVMQCLLLQLIGAAQVLTSVSRARESGMLEFHRMSPQRPIAVVVGFLFGGPLLEYLLFGCTLPFSIVIAIGQMTFLRWLVILIAILMAAVLYHAAAILAGLVMRKGAISPVLMIGLFVFLYPFVGLVMSPTPLSYFTVFPTISAVVDQPRNQMFGDLLPAFCVSLIHQIPVLIVLLFATSRKMRHETTLPLSKLGAIIAYALIAILAMMDYSIMSGMPERLFGTEAGKVTLPMLSYTLLVVGMLLCASVTPDLNAFARGTRQALKKGLPGLSLWNDRAPNWITVAVVGVITLLVGLIASRLVASQFLLSEKAIWAAATTACAVIFFSLAKQSFDLLFRKNSLTFLVLLLFIAWGVPLLLDMVLMISNPGYGHEMGVIMSISPLAGIGAIFAGPPSAKETALAASAFFALCSIALCWWAVNTASVKEKIVSN